MKKTYKNDWFRKGIAFRKQEEEERSELLKDHRARWAKKTQELHQECEEDGGHDFEDLPKNGFNQPNYATGEWPQGCCKCRKRK